MTTQTQQTLSPSIFPARFQILSGSALKLLACILMLIDHTGVLILAKFSSMERARREPGAEHGEAKDKASEP